MDRHSSTSHFARSRRAFTAVEAAAAFAVGGSVLVVAVPAFVRELHSSLQAEATYHVTELAHLTVAYAENRAVAEAFPESAPLTPSVIPRGKREADPPGAWDHPTWRALHFRPFDEGVVHAYAFELVTNLGPTKSTFRAIAHGDLDGDGTLSTFEVRGVDDESAVGVRLEPGMIVDAELE